MFTKATKKKAKARIAISGVSGAGKTYSALQMASHMGGKIALIDTEGGSADKYADLFNFDSAQLDSYAPRRYIDAITEAEESGYDVIIIDSISHAWAGKDGILEMVNRISDKNSGGSGNSYTAWGKATPQHNALVEAIVHCKCHLIVTMRAKSDYVMETDSRGKQVPKKVGMAPIQRDGLEYEFDIFAEMNLDHVMVVTKSRCPALDQKSFELPGKNVTDVLMKWLNSGVDAPPREKPQPAPEPEEDDSPAPLAERMQNAAEIAEWSGDDSHAQQLRETAAHIKADLISPKDTTDLMRCNPKWTSSQIIGCVRKMFPELPSNWSAAMTREQYNQAKLHISSKDPA